MAFTAQMLDSFDNYTDLSLRWLTWVTASIGAGGRGSSNRLLTGAGTGSSGSVYSPLTTAVTTRITGVAFKFNPNNQNTVVLVQTRSGTTVQCDVRSPAVSPAGTSRTLQITRNGSTIWTGVTTYSPYVWHHLCLKIEQSATAGRVILIVDGVEEANFTGVTQTVSTTNNVGLIGLGQTEYDDFYTGSSDTLDNTDMPGDLRVAPVYAASDVDTDFIPEPAGDHYANVDEDLHDSDTSYISSRVAGDIDTFGVTALPTPAITIHVVAPFMVARKDDAGVRTARVLAKSGASTATGSTVTLTEGYLMYQAFLPTNPDTGLAWEPDEVDDMLVGVEVVA